ncbi:hypothetical protein WJX73_002993 [Symbiochloris irregularis]|uniref:PSI-G n=1 Tax=Symbiochloris irregularis TaxID=706552 RepID=A0AAW1NP76_9CHLO
MLATSRAVSCRAPIGRRQLKTQAVADTALVISGATATSLALGRFVFLPFHRDNLKRQQPRQNDTPYAEAGDRLAQEATFATTTNDPAGFTFVDVLGWGALGHAVGYALLATTSLQAAGFNPKPDALPLY